MSEIELGAGIRSGLGTKIDGKEENQENEDESHGSEKFSPIWGKGEQEHWGLVKRILWFL